jgi:hypothetical protein
MGVWEKGLGWTRAAWRWAVGVLKLNRRVKALEEMVRRAPPRPMEPYKGILVARARHRRDDDDLNEACCLYCFQIGLDSPCKKGETRDGGIELRCANPAHAGGQGSRSGRVFTAELTRAEYDWAMNRLYVPLG